jgi:hypothetical protein
MGSDSKYPRCSTSLPPFNLAKKRTSSKSACCLEVMMMKVRYIKVLRETYNIRTRYLRYRGGFDLEECAEGAVLANDSM